MDGALPRSTKTIVGRCRVGRILVHHLRIHICRPTIMVETWNCEAAADGCAVNSGSPKGASYEEERVYLTEAGVTVTMSK